MKRVGIRNDFQKEFEQLERILGLEMIFERSLNKEILCLAELGMAFDPSNMTPIGVNLWAHTFQTIPEGLVL